MDLNILCVGWCGEVTQELDGSKGQTKAFLIYPINLIMYDF